MRTTTTLLLKKPEGTDSVKLQDFNDNADKIDAEFHCHQAAIDAANIHSNSPHVMEIKGSSEAAYRTGQVNITKDNIGLSNVPNVATNDQTPTYTEATVLSELTSGEKLSAALGKIKLAVKNVKTLLQMLGNTDISGVGNGTVTGALAAMNSNLDYSISIVDNAYFTVSHATCCVKNGVAYCQIRVLCKAVIRGWTTVASGFPTPNPKYCQPVGVYISCGDIDTIAMRIVGNELVAMDGIANLTAVGTFTYIV